MPVLDSTASCQVRQRSARDSGATLIEILIAVVLLGAGAVAVLAATTAAVIGSNTSDQIAAAQRSVSEAADFITDTEPENVAHQPCTTPGVAAAYEANLDAKFGTDAIDVVAVRYWNSTTGSFGATCHEADGDRIQEIELRSTVGESSRSIRVVKRPTSVPTLDTVPAPTVPPYAGGSGQAVVSLTPGL